MRGGSILFFGLIIILSFTIVYLHGRFKEGFQAPGSACGRREDLYIDLINTYIENIDKIQQSDGADTYAALENRYIDAALSGGSTANINVGDTLENVVLCVRNGYTRALQQYIDANPAAFTNILGQMSMDTIINEAIVPEYSEDGVRTDYLQLRNTAYPIGKFVSQYYRALLQPPTQFIQIDRQLKPANNDSIVFKAENGSTVTFTSMRSTLQTRLRQYYQALIDLHKQRSVYILGTVPTPEQIGQGVQSCQLCAGFTLRDPIAVESYFTVTRITGATFELRMINTTATEMCQQDIIQRFSAENKTFEIVENPDKSKNGAQCSRVVTAEMLGLMPTRTRNFVIDWAYNRTKRLIEHYYKDTPTTMQAEKDRLLRLSASTVTDFTQKVNLDVIAQKFYDEMGGQYAISNIKDVSTVGSTIVDIRFDVVKHANPDAINEKIRALKDAYSKFKASPENPLSVTEDARASYYERLYELLDEQDRNIERTYTGLVGRFYYTPTSNQTSITVQGFTLDPALVTSYNPLFNGGFDAPMRDTPGNANYSPRTEYFLNPVPLPRPLTDRDALLEILDEYKDILITDEMKWKIQNLSENPWPDLSGQLIITSVDAAQQIWPVSGQPQSGFQVVLRWKETVLDPFTNEPANIRFRTAAGGQTFGKLENVQRQAVFTYKKNTEQWYATEWFFDTSGFYFLPTSSRVAAQCLFNTTAFQASITNPGQEFLEKLPAQRAKPCGDANPNVIFSPFVYGVLNPEAVRRVGTGSTALTRDFLARGRGGLGQIILAPAWNLDTGNAIQPFSVAKPLPYEFQIDTNKGRCPANTCTNPIVLYKLMEDENLNRVWALSPVKLNNVDTYTKLNFLRIRRAVTAGPDQCAVEADVEKVTYTSATGSDPVNKLVKLSKKNLIDIYNSLKTSIPDWVNQMKDDTSVDLKFKESSRQVLKNALYTFNLSINPTECSITSYQLIEGSAFIQPNTPLLKEPVEFGTRVVNDLLNVGSMEAAIQSSVSAASQNVVQTINDYRQNTASYKTIIDGEVRITPIDVDVYRASPTTNGITEVRFTFVRSRGTDTQSGSKVGISSIALFKDGSSIRSDDFTYTVEGKTTLNEKAQKLNPSVYNSDINLTQDEYLQLDLNDKVLIKLGGAGVFIDGFSLSTGPNVEEDPIMWRIEAKYQGNNAWQIIYTNESLIDMFVQTNLAASDRTITKLPNTELTFYRDDGLPSDERSKIGPLIGPLNTQAVRLSGVLPRSAATLNSAARTFINDRRTRILNGYATFQRNKFIFSQLWNEISEMANTPSALLGNMSLITLYASTANTSWRYFPGVTLDDINKAIEIEPTNDTYKKMRIIIYQTDYFVEKIALVYGYKALKAKRAIDDTSICPSQYLTPELINVLYVMSVGFMNSYIPEGAAETTAKNKINNLLQYTKEVAYNNPSTTFQEISSTQVRFNISGTRTERRKPTVRASSTQIFNTIMNMYNNLNNLDTDGANQITLSFNQTFRNPYFNRVRSTDQTFNDGDFSCIIRAASPNDTICNTVANSSQRGSVVSSFQHTMNVTDSTTGTISFTTNSGVSADNNRMYIENTLRLANNLNDYFTRTITYNTSSLVRTRQISIFNIDLVKEGNSNLSNGINEGGVYRTDFLYLFSLFSGGDWIYFRLNNKPFSIYRMKLNTAFNTQIRNTTFEEYQYISASQGYTWKMGGKLTDDISGYIDKRFNNNLATINLYLSRFRVRFLSNDLGNGRYSTSFGTGDSTSILRDIYPSGSWIYFIDPRVTNKTYRVKITITTNSAVIDTEFQEISTYSESPSWTAVTSFTKGKIYEFFIINSPISFKLDTYRVTFSSNTSLRIDAGIYPTNGSTNVIQKAINDTYWGGGTEIQRLLAIYGTNRWIYYRRANDVNRIYRMRITNTSSNPLTITNQLITNFMVHSHNPLFTTNTSYSTVAVSDITAETSMDILVYEPNNPEVNEGAFLYNLYDTNISFTPKFWDSGTDLVDSTNKIVSDSTVSADSFSYIKELKDRLTNQATYEKIVTNITNRFDSTLYTNIKTQIVPNRTQLRSYTYPLSPEATTATYLENYNTNLTRQRTIENTYDRDFMAAIELIDISGTTTKPQEVPTLSNPCGLLGRTNADKTRRLYSPDECRRLGGEYISEDKCILTDAKDYTINMSSLTQEGVFLLTATASSLDLYYRTGINKSAEFILKNNRSTKYRIEFTSLVIPANITGINGILETYNSTERTWIRAGNLPKNIDLQILAYTPTDPVINISEYCNYVNNNAADTIFMRAIGNLITSRNGTMLDIAKNSFPRRGWYTYLLHPLNKYSAKTILAQNQYRPRSIYECQTVIQSPVTINLLGDYIYNKYSKKLYGYHIDSPIFGRAFLTGIVSYYITYKSNTENLIYIQVNVDQFEVGKPMAKIENLLLKVIYKPSPFCSSSITASDISDPPATELSSSTIFTNFTATVNTNLLNTNVKWGGYPPKLVPLSITECANLQRFNANDYKWLEVAGRMVYEEYSKQIPGYTASNPHTGRAFLIDIEQYTNEGGASSLIFVPIITTITDTYIVTNYNSDNAPFYIELILQSDFKCEVIQNHRLSTLLYNKKKTDYTNLQPYPTVIMNEPTKTARAPWEMFWRRPYIQKLQEYNIYTTSIKDKAVETTYYVKDAIDNYGLVRRINGTTVQNVSPEGIAQFLSLYPDCEIFESSYDAINRRFPVTTFFNTNTTLTLTAVNPSPFLFVRSSSSYKVLYNMTFIVNRVRNPTIKQASISKIGFFQNRNIINNIQYGEVCIINLNNSTRAPTTVELGQIQSLFNYTNSTTIFSLDLNTVKGFRMSFSSGGVLANGFTFSTSSLTPDNDPVEWELSTNSNIMNTSSWTDVAFKFGTTTLLSKSYDTPTQRLTSLPIFLFNNNVIERNEIAGFQDYSASIIKEAQNIKPNIDKYQENPVLARGFGNPQLATAQESNIDTLFALPLKQKVPIEATQTAIKTPPEPPQIQQLSYFKYIRFRPLKTRDGATTRPSVGTGAFLLYDELHKPIESTVVGGLKASNPMGTWTGKAAEIFGPAASGDWKDGHGSALVFAFGEPQIVTGLQFKTAAPGSSPGQDPVRWKIEGSQNGTYWETLHDQSRSDFPVGTARGIAQPVIWFT